MIRSEAQDGNRTARAAALAALVAIGCVIAFIFPGRAAAGELVYKGCVSDTGTPRISGAKSCEAVGKGAFNPLNALAVSPDGRSLYAGAGVQCKGLYDFRCSATAAVDRFELDRKTGAPDYRNCLTAATEQHRICTELPTATEHAFGAPFGDVASMAVSPDGDSLYLASGAPTCYGTDEGGQECFGSDALARFARDSETGAITYADCITGDRRSGPSGSGACTEIPTATADGGGSGLEDLRSIAVTADGRSLYASADNSLARFDRDPDTGELTYRGCVTGDKRLGPTGSGACKEIPTATDDGAGSGLDALGSIVSSDDGSSLYGVAYNDVFRFDRDPQTGALTYRGCVTGDRALGPSGSGACSEIPTATARYGRLSGLASPVSLALGANGRSLYVGAVGSAAIARFDRDPATGAITFAGCLTSSPRVGPSGSGACHEVRHGSGSAPLSPYFMALGGDGRSLYTASQSIVNRLRLNRATGSLHYADCLTGAKDLKHCKKIPTAVRYWGSGLEDITALAASGSTLYAATDVVSQDGGDIATLAIAPQTKIRGAKVHGRRAVIRFKADKPSRFKCKLKGEGVPGKLRHWRHCGSHGFRQKGRQVYRGLPRGKQVFRVRATDRAHTTDPTAAKTRWRVR